MGPGRRPAHRVRAATVGLAALLFHEPSAGHGAHLTHVDDGASDGRDGSDPSSRHIVTSDGSSYRYRYRAVGLTGQGVLSGAGAHMAGLISTGVGEATLPGLVRRSGFPLPVAAATSTVVVAAPVAGAALTHLVELGREGGFSAIPWNLLVWAVPGAVGSAYIGTFRQGRVPERATRLGLAGLFGLIGIVFLAVFGLGVGAASLV